MKWTDKTPTEPGWYWLKGNKSNNLPVVVEVTNRQMSGGLIYRMINSPGEYDLSDSVKWSDRLTEPK